MLPSRLLRFLPALLCLGPWATPLLAGADASPPATLGSGPISTVDHMLSTPFFSFPSGLLRSRLGVDVATAGDVNGDGFSDVVAIGVSTAPGSATTFYLFFGGATGMTLAPGFPVTSLPGGAEMARGVGDLDGNGLADVAIAYPGTTSGSFQVFFGRNGTLDMANPFIVNEPGLDGYGKVVAPAGDVNGDGVDDLAVGSPDADNISFCSVGFSGMVDVFYGAAGTGPTLANRWRASGCMWVGVDGKFGAGVGAAGDVNGDGFDDLAIGAPWAPRIGFPETFCGRVFVVHGSASGLPVSPVNPAHGVPGDADVLEPAANNGAFGVAVITAGDVNADGFADLAVGSPEEDFTSTDSGALRVFAGSTSGTQPNVVLFEGAGNPSSQYGRRVFPAGDVNGDARPELLVGHTGAMYLNMNNGNGIQFGLNIQGPELSYCTAGDVNGDGLSDIVVGNPRFSVGLPAEGQIQVFVGRGGLPAVDPNWTFKAAIESANLGAVVAAAGDVNGDGFEDVLTSAPSLHAPDNNGAVFLNYGSATGLTPNFSDWSFVGSEGDVLGWAVCAAGDVNGDGYGDFMAGGHQWGGGPGKVLVWHGRNGGVPMGAAPNLTLNGETNGSWFGATLTSGDFNGDGYADIAVGASETSDQGLDYRGRVFVYVGSPTGLNPTPAFQRAGQAYDHLGQALVGDIDLNGDGYTDLVIGAPTSDGGGGTQSGRIEIWLGQGVGPPLTVGTGRSGDNANDRFGDRLANGGDVNGDGFGDLIVGMPLRNGSTGRAEVWHGQPSPPNGNLISFAPDWSQDGIQPGVQFGSSVSSAGDVNGDGLSDVIVGSPLEGIGTLTESGRVRVFVAPLSDVADWGPVILADGGRFGSSVANAGDVNGDGWNEIIVGSPANSENAPHAGRTDVFYGAQGIGRMNWMIPQRSDGRRVQLRGLADNSSVLLVNLVTTAAGRGKIRMQWDFERAVAFPQVPITGTQSAFTLTGPPAGLGSGAVLVTNVTGLSTGAPYAWRARTLSRSIYFPTTKWISPARSAAREYDLRTPGSWVGVDDEVALAADLALAAPWPNPTTGSSHVRFDLPRAADASLAVLDLQGRRIRSLIHGRQVAGRHQVEWDGRDDSGSLVGPGVYFYRLDSERVTRTARVAVVR